MGIGLLAGLIGAAVVAGVAGARRSETAFDRLAERTGQPDASLVTFVEPAFLDAVLALPEVEDAWPVRGVVGQVLDRPTVSYLAVVSGPLRPAGLVQPLIQSGRLPADDQADEVAVADALATAQGIEVGDVLPLGLLTQEEFEAFDIGFGEPDGPRVDLAVVGTFTLAGNEDTQEVGLLGSPAFHREYSDQGGGGNGAMIRLVDEPDATDRFAAGVVAAATAVDLPADAAELGAYDLDLAADVRRRSHTSAAVVARGLLLVAAAALVVGLLGLVQTVGRHQSRSIGARPELGALGMDRAQRTVASVLPFALVAVPVAVVGTGAGAVALSPLLPIGSARRLEPSPGVEVNLVVVGLGSLVMGLLLVLIVAGVAAGRERRRGPDRVTGVSPFGRVLRSGLPLSAAVGTAFALDRGRSSLTVRAAMAGGVVAVAAVVGAATFGASVARLVDTPARYGAPGDLVVSDVRDDFLEEAQADEDIAAVLETRNFDVLVDGAPRDALSSEVLKGSIGFRYLEGRAPDGPAEVALGPALAARLDVGIGDTVSVGEAAVPTTVVGTVLARADTGASYADTVIVADEVRATESAGGVFREAIVRFADGVDVDARVAALAADLEVEAVEAPPRIRDIAQIRNLPLVLAGGAALLGIALLGHAVAATVRRRGRDLALLRALGTRPRESAVAVVALAVVLVLVGVVFGIPVGILVGNLAWRVLAASLFVDDALTIPVLVVLTCLPVGLVVGLAAAAWPTRRAEHLAVADQLRRE